MKTKFIIWFVLIFPSMLFSQWSPRAFNYQAVVRDASGNIRANTPVTVQCDIFYEGIENTGYSEQFETTTNEYGLINLQIGRGTVLQGDFRYIEWGYVEMYLEVRIDGIILGRTEILSVPYAIVAEYAGTASNGLFSDDKPVKADSESHNTSTGINSLDIANGEYNTAYGYSSLSSITTGEGNSGVGYLTLYNNTIGCYNTSVGNLALANNTEGSGNTATGSFSLNENTTGFDNTALGYYSMAANKTGYNNTAIGNYSLQLDTSGYENTAVGYNSLKHNLSGNYNTAVGSYALYYNLSGYNTAFGYNSLKNNMTGVLNTAGGFESLFLNETGNHNSAFGDSALYSNRTGNWNVAMGSKALFRNETSDKNTAVGYGALANTTRWDNTAVGFNSLFANTEGFDNTAIGVEALKSNTTAVGNTAIGKNAMDSQVTGSNNTAIGFNSDVSNGITNSTAIGSNASVSSSNRIVLGNSSVTSIGGYANWTNYSDRRLKENIVYTNALGLNFITRLKPVTYNYINDVNKHKRNGLIAQDVQRTLTDLGIDFSGLVIEDNKEKTLNLSYSEFVLPLITAVQELNQKNRTLEERIEKLEKIMESK